MSLNNRITERRKSLGLTKAELAKRSGITPAAVCNIENGSRLPMLPVASKLADTLAVSIDFLAGRSDSLDIVVPSKATQAFFKEFQTLSKEDQDFIRSTIEHLKKR
jgi:transcriptional regulator with XRE-family HTH domain